MARTIRFHLDEHVATAVADGLRRLEIDVTTSTDARLLGATDGAQIAFALAHRRVIFTQDDDFLALAAHGIEHARIVYCHQQTRSIGDIVRGLQLIWEVYEPEEMRNRIEFI
jgi:predicted nuclease of predicted toxin-antitoxin system